MENKNIPVYDVQLEDWHEGVFATSLVEKPAIMSDFVFFSEEENTIMMFADEEKREVVGAVMIPDLLMPRKAEDGSLFYVKFSKEVIYKLNERMKEYGYDKSFTFAHSYNAGNNVKLLESWIKEFEQDKSVAYGFDLPVGTMFMKVKVEEDTLWEMIKEHKLNGFSIELNASYKLNDEQEKQEENMSKVDLFERNLTVGDYNLVYDGEETITNDTVLFHVTKEVVEDKETEKVSKFTGEFEMEDKIYNVENGVVSVEEKAPEVQEENKDVFDMDGFMEKLNTMFEEKINSLREEFSSKNDEISGSLEEVKLFQKQGSVKEQEKEKEQSAEVEEFSRLENLNTINGWLKSRNKRK